MRGLSLAALAAAVACACFAASAGADTVGPITFESPDYTLGNINGQQGWSNAGSFDAAVAAGFGSQALRISDAVTSGSFGDQTFSPGLATPASESSTIRRFDAKFTIGTTSPDVQPGLHLSVSPDDGTGARMSYLRFEDQSDGVHVFFDDAKDAGPLGTIAEFSDSDIATLSRGTPHTIELSITLVPGPANDVVNVYLDGALAHTGTTWEDYYRYDPEQAPANAVPAIHKLLFREAGTADPANLGGGFVIDDVTLTSSAVCMPTGVMKDGMNLTAAQIGGDVTGTLDATGCNIGVYDGSVHGGEIYGANYFGVYVDQKNIDVVNGNIHDIGETSLNGAQHGVGVEYADGGTGTLSATTITNYQKNGVVIDGQNTSVSVLGNTVTGEGPVDWIAQNGIQVSDGASALIKGNTVSGNWYTPRSWVACGLLFYQAGGVKQQGNTLFGNEIDMCNAGRGGGNNTSAG